MGRRTLRRDGPNSCCSMCSTCRTGAPCGSHGEIGGNGWMLGARLFFQVEEQRESALEPQSLVDHMQVILDRPFGDTKSLRQLFVAQPADSGASHLDLTPRQCVERVATGSERRRFIEPRVEPLPPGVNVAHAAEKTLRLGLLEHDPVYFEGQCLHQL